MSTLPLTPFTRASNLFLIELILICALIRQWRLDVGRDFSLFPKNSDSKFGFRVGGTVFETLSVETSLIFATDIQNGLIKFISFINTRDIIY